MGCGTVSVTPYSLKAAHHSVLLSCTTLSPAVKELDPKHVYSLTSCFCRFLYHLPPSFLFPLAARSITHRVVRHRVRSPLAPLQTLTMKGWSRAPCARVM